QNESLATTRAGLRRSSDPRAVRTRERLFLAVQRLSATEETVTVSRLAREAGVSRAVFYTHFTDVGDLVLRMAEEQYAVIAEAAGTARRSDPHGAMMQAQHDLVAHVEANRQLYRAALQLPVERGITSRMAEVMAGPIREHIAAVGTLPAGLRTDVAAAYIAAAATGLLSGWVLGEVDLDADTLARHLYALMPPWMHSDQTTTTMPAPTGSYEGDRK
ncbi:MAG: TetR/AcrR family transcriptional regulator, partial [Propioniciclava sp.]